ncbi:signal recognition particle-docking protein FtsY [Aliidiomarina shirensis]|uniref:Signal recognition particle receptor FtsY n=1 Tax=Aliidiomarina shirensis TaxID=1048642 RepID=A0A432WVE5_9GAMM|nr:signal recognition particle-docking protein FtsY [Aliidiomarina shirensis]RUO37717.1 signal recognition particle-docking protein FtsY [Aliidiomarina shirensis]
MAKKRSLFSSLFGRKQADEELEQKQQEKQTTDVDSASSEEKSDHASAVDSAASAAKTEQEPEQPNQREGTDLPSAVDDAAAMQSKITPPPTSSPEPVVEAKPPIEQESIEQAPVEVAPPAAKKTTQDRPQRTSWWQRLRQGLQKTSSSLGSGLANLFVGKEIDEELFEDLETQLLMADVGVETTAKIIDQLTDHASRKELKDAGLLYTKLKDDMAAMLAPVSEPLNLEKSDGPFVILMVGVNGVGKTTTIGKLARQFQSEGKSVMLAAGDTFRAAAVEQLQVWGERNSIPVIAQHTGADSASVIFDAVQAAKARGVDVLIADTAGRLQNKANLMEELKKIVRVMRKLDDAMPHEVLLTLDAGTGQNAISQAKLFNEAVGVTGLAMTKLDGTAKGGVIFALANQFKIPIRYIGVGESLEDLRPFVASEFVDALFANASGTNASAPNSPQEGTQ